MPGKFEHDPYWMNLVHRGMMKKNLLPDAISARIKLNKAESLDIINWSIVDSDSRILNFTFKDILLPKNLSRFDIAKYSSIEDFLRIKKNPVVLDLMSYGHYVYELARGGLIHHGLSVNLKKSSENTVPSELKKIATTMFLDILDPLADKKIRAWLHERGLKGFDLIINHGCGGVTSIPRDICYQYGLLNNYWNLLTVGGMLLTQSAYNEVLLEELTRFLGFHSIPAVQSLGQVPNAKALRNGYFDLAHQSQVLRLDKLMHSPMYLPIPEIN